MPSLYQLEVDRICITSMQNCFGSDHLVPDLASQFVSIFKCLLKDLNNDICDREKPIKKSNPGKSEHKYNIKINQK